MPGEVEGVGVVGSSYMPEDIVRFDGKGCMGGLVGINYTQHTCFRALICACTISVNSTHHHSRACNFFMTTPGLRFPTDSQHLASFRLA